MIFVVNFGIRVDWRPEMGAAGFSRGGLSPLGEEAGVSGNLHPRLWSELQGVSASFAQLA